MQKIVLVKAGRQLRLTAIVTGRPNPSVTWSKTPNGELLGERSSIECSADSFNLVIDKANRYDAGLYTVIANNSSGLKEASIVVKVLGMSFKGFVCVLEKIF